jgi:hypothetical protein
MTIREAIHTDLHDYTALTDVVGPRIYEIEADEGDWSNFVVWFKVDDARYRNNENVTIPIRQARMQFSCYSEDRFEAREIANLIDNRYNNYSGSLASGVSVQLSQVIDDRDQGREGDFFRVDLDIAFKYRTA